MFFERGMSRAHVQVDGSSVQLRFSFVCRYGFMVVVLLGFSPG